MDYEKMYKEALERAKESMKDGGISSNTITYLESIFPELKESEDEKIIHWIRKELESKYVVDNIVNNEMADKALAWLEKQGEFKNIDSDDLATLETWEDAIKENKEKWQLSDWFVEATSLLIQKVKRIENNENINIKGSRVMLNACINALRTVGHSHLSDWLEKQGEQKASYTNIVETGNGGINALVTRELPTDGEQKPTDEEMIALLRTEYEKGRADAIAEMQKPAWSEEDENIIRLSIENLTELEDRYGKKYGKVGDCIDWLKSLRPKSHWKPSEEMLEALYRVIPENVMEKSEDEILLDKLYQGLKHGRVQSDK